MTSKSSNSKQICHITSAHPANDIRIFHKECATLAQSGYEVHLVAKGELPPNTKGVIHHVLPPVNVTWRLGRMVVRAWQSFCIAKKTKAKSFHFHDAELLPYGLILKWQGNVVIYDAHEDLPRDILTKTWIPQRLRKSVSILVEQIENYIARRMDKVVCATPFICKRFREIGANAVEVKNYPQLGELCIDFPMINTSSDTPAICYVGIISLQRGIVEMIKAIEGLNVRLILAGNFVDKKTESIVRALSGWKKVDYRGNVSREGIRDIFSESQLGLCLFLPSETHNESMPNKLFEYMSAELPVLCSNFSTWRTIVESADCGLCVNPKDVQAISEGIQWILDNPEKAKQNGLRGRQAVVDSYNWDEESRQLLTVYSQIKFSV